MQTFILKIDSESTPEHSTAIFDAIAFLSKVKGLGVTLTIEGPGRHKTVKTIEDLEPTAPKASDITSSKTELAKRRERVRKWYEKGLTNTAIGEKLNIKASTVYNDLNALRNQGLIKE